MKFNKQRDKDCYLYTQNGEFMDEEKIEDDLKIMPNNDDFTEENNENSKNKNDLYDNLSNYTDKLPNKKTFNFVLISIFSITIILLSISIAKVSKIILVDNSKRVSELYVLSDGINNANNCLKDYYDTINNSIRNYNSYSFSRNIQSVEQKAKEDLNSINSLGSHINKKYFSKSIEILTSRYNNLLNLCTKLFDVSNSEYISIYNDYTEIEISQRVDLINSLSKYFDKLGIEHTINEDNSLSYIKK